MYIVVCRFASLLYIVVFFFFFCNLWLLFFFVLGITQTFFYNTFLTYPKKKKHWLLHKIHFCISLLPFIELSVKIPWKAQTVFTSVTHPRPIGPVHHSAVKWHLQWLQKFLVQPNYFIYISVLRLDQSDYSSLSKLLIELKHILDVKLRALENIYVMTILACINIPHVSFLLSSSTNTS